MTTNPDYKIKGVLKDAHSSAFRTYRDIYYGDTSLWYVLKTELIVTFTAGLSGAFGLMLRQLLYPGLFKQCGRKVVFGKNLTLRHAHKIELGDRVVLDDNVVIDAKGESNEGIRLGNDVYVGRNTIIYCKNGDIHIGDQVNISSNCQFFSCNRLDIGPQTVIAAFCYLLSGGQYNLNQPEVPFAEQSGMSTAAPTRIGANCWLAAGVVIPDGVTLDEHVAVAAGAVVTQDMAANQLCGGVPARPIKSLKAAN